MPCHIVKPARGLFQSVHIQKKEKRSKPSCVLAAAGAYTVGEYADWVGSRTCEYLRIVPTFSRSHLQLGHEAYLSELLEYVPIS